MCLRPLPAKRRRRGLIGEVHLQDVDAAASLQANRAPGFEVDDAPTGGAELDAVAGQRQVSHAKERLLNLGHLERDGALL